MTRRRAERRQAKLVCGHYAHTDSDARANDLERCPIDGYVRIQYIVDPYRTEPEQTFTQVAFNLADCYDGGTGH